MGHVRPSRRRVVSGLLCISSHVRAPMCASRAGSTSNYKRRGLIRNACVVAGNSGDEALVPFLAPLLRDSEPLIREHALWALAQLLPPKKTQVYV